MKLIGRYISPYVRRVAISLNALGMPFEIESVPVFDQPKLIRAYNPLGRVPALVLDDGETLVESYAILDALDQLAGDKRLTPAADPARRKVMQITAIGVGAMDCTVGAVYEGMFHPKEKIEQSWIEHNEQQAVSGCEWLDKLAQKAGDGWLAGPQLTQADITAGVSFSFAKRVRPKLGLAEKFPALEAHNARCEALDAFKQAPLPPPE